VTLTAVAVYSGFTIVELRGLRRLQAETIDRNRLDSLLLLRIQNDLNSLALGMRDMLDSTEPYPLTAWKPQFKRIRIDLDDAMAREANFAPANRLPDQRRYLSNSAAQFWDAFDRAFELAGAGREAEAREQIRMSLQARQAALSTAVARLLLQNNADEQEVSAEARAIYGRAERQVYYFVAAVLVVVLATSLYLIHYNRQMFGQLEWLAERRSELAQQLMAIQENTFRYIARELHDDFGQILTAMGAMLQRVDRRVSPLDSSLREDLAEVRGIAQSTLEKVRSLSQALHPVILDEAGFEAALQAHLPAFEKQTGIEIRYERKGVARSLNREVSIHLFRVLQEALNNVARHSKSKSAAVRLEYSPEAVVLEVQDAGAGLNGAQVTRGMGLFSMRERAELLNGRLELLPVSGGGTLVRFTAPLRAEEVHAEA
jgi:signal transduction histidine kinase